MLQFKKNYNFTTLAPAILGAVYNNMKYIGSCTSEEAQIIKNDILNIHEQLRNVISGLPKVTDCEFYKFKDSLGNLVVISREYIDINSIVEVSKINIRVDIYDTTTDSISIINNRLKELGYNNFKIELVD